MTIPKAPTLLVSTLESGGEIEMAPPKNDGRNNGNNSDVESVLSERDALLSQADLDSEPFSKPDPHRSTRVKLYVAVFIANIAFQILAPAETKIFEQIFCNGYFLEHDPTQIPSSGLVPEEQCKNATIQRQLALLKSWYETFDALPALIMSIPLGIIMDVIGRRPLLLLCLSTVAAQQFWIAFVCTLNGSIPLQAVWLAPLLNFFSGGLIVLQMVFMCVICDVTPKETLAASLFRLTAVGELTKVLGPVIAGGLMQVNVWWAVILGLSGLLLLLAVAWTVPETLIIVPASPAPSMTNPSTEAHLHFQSVPPTPLPPPPPRLHLLHRTRTLISTGIHSLAIVWTDQRLIILVLLSPLIQFGGTLGDVLQQYISVRYNWTLASSTFIFSLQGTAATFSLFLLLPWFSTYLETTFPTTLGRSPTALNATISRLSLLLVLLAWSLEGLAPTIPLLLLGLAFETLGLGGPAALKALAATLVEPKDNGRVFSVLAVAQVLSTVVAHPMTAALFGVGLDKGGGLYLGMPFFVAAAGTAVACAVLCAVSFQRKHGGGDDDDDGDGDSERVSGARQGPVHL